MAVATRGVFGFARHFPHPVGGGGGSEMGQHGGDILPRVEYCYRALFGGDHIKSPF